MNTQTQLNMTVQGRLAELGYYRLKVDGFIGPGTENALIAFKEAHGLRARPLPGPITLGTLFGARVKPAPLPKPAGDEPLWLAEARRLMGTREVPGAGNNPTIMGWARDLDQWYPGDDTPWCGLFVAHCMSLGAPDEPQDFNRLGARSWLEYGVDAGAAVTPRLGSIAVFWRTHPTKSWHGHVALLTGYSADALRVIGGNQQNNVTETWISRERLLGLRLPEGASPPHAPRAETGALSTNEA